MIHTLTTDLSHPNNITLLVGSRFWSHIQELIIQKYVTLTGTNSKRFYNTKSKQRIRVWEYECFSYLFRDHPCEISLGFVAKIFDKIKNRKPRKLIHSIIATDQTVCYFSVDHHVFLVWESKIVYGYVQPKAHTTCLQADWWISSSVNWLFYEARSC